MSLELNYADFKYWQSSPYQVAKRFHAVAVFAFPVGLNCILFQDESNLFKTNRCHLILLRFFDCFDLIAFFKLLFLAVYPFFI